MKLVVFGLSISSSWGNGHATTYRALLKAFATRGHQITFYEWDAPWYSGDNRDLESPDFLDLVLYSDWNDVRPKAIQDARTADAAMVGSYVHGGITIIDELVEARVDPLFFYDIDTPVTVAALRSGTAEYLRPDQVPLFTSYLSFTGGPFLTKVLKNELGAQDARPLYCSVDVENYQPSGYDAEFDVDLAYMGTYAADRQPVIDRFLIEVARKLPEKQFIVAGPQYPEADWPSNVRLIPHLSPARHPAFYSTAKWQLNATRADMVAAGWSPSVRLFEAGAVAAPIISDWWEGIDELFEPGREILLPHTADEVARILTGTSEGARRAMGQALRERIIAEHSSERRAEELEQYMSGVAAETGAESAGAAR